MDGSPQAAGKVRSQGAANSFEQQNRKKERTELIGFATDLEPRKPPQASGKVRTKDAKRRSLGAGQAERIAGRS